MAIRRIYNNIALLAGPSPATGTQTTNLIKRIHRVQSLNLEVNIPLQDINEFGTLPTIDRVNLDGAETSMDFSYLITDFQNEENLGFVIDSTNSAVSAFLNKTEDERNYFKAVAPEGIDAVGRTAANVAVWAIGNGFISSYSSEGAVGGFPTANVTVQGLTATAHTSGSAQATPAINPTTGAKIAGNFTLPTIPASAAAKPSILRPGDISLTFGAGVVGLGQTLSNLKLQSYNLSVDLNREPVQALGSRFAVSKEITFPVAVTLQVEALLNDIASVTSGMHTNDIICADQEGDVEIDLSTANCTGGPSTIYAKYILKNVQLTSQSISNSIGPSSTVSLTFNGQISASGDTTNGLFMSGVYGYTGVGGGDGGATGVAAFSN